MWYAKDEPIDVMHRISAALSGLSKSVACSTRSETDFSHGKLSETLKFRACNLIADVCGIACGTDVDED